MVRILISGDFCPIGRNNQIIDEEKFSSLFNGFENIVKKVDYAIVNLECPITTSISPIEKIGPNIKSENLKAFDALKYAGFDLLTLANNHIQDYGTKGVLDTIAHAKAFDFDVVGAGANIEDAKKLFIQKIKGTRVGFLNIAENEFCKATDDTAGAYTLDLIDNFNQIKDSKQKVDKLILIYHGGREHYQLPTPEQRKRFRFFIESGVDAIVAHHTHCISGYEYYLNKPIVYSLGNFIFDYKKKYQTGKWTVGMSVVLSLNGENFKHEFIPHFQGRFENSSLQLATGNEKQKLLDEIEKLSSQIINDEEFEKSWNNYLKNDEEFYLSSLYVKNFFIRALFIKGILPVSLLRSKHNKLLLNLMRCETHHEISKDVLNVKR